MLDERRSEPFGVPWPADVAKPVDAADLKSASLHESAGSSPAVRTTLPFDIRLSAILAVRKPVFEGPVENAPSLIGPHIAR